ncbi:MAG: isochorismatase family protein [bacterium]|nr:isochorismatase family protein [bacterium]
MSRLSPQTALVVVDVQNDFADPEGSLYVSGAGKVVEAVNRLVERAQEEGWPVFYTQDWHPETTPHFAKDGGIWPVHCVGGSRGADFHPDLVVEGVSVKKGGAGEDGYSGFTMRDLVEAEDRPTALHSLLQERNIARVVVVGLALDYCVKDTALDAVRLGYEVEVPLDATAAVNLSPDDGEKSIAALQAAGVSVS